MYVMVLWQRSLATDLQSLSMELRRNQSTYLKRLQQQKEVCPNYSLLIIDYWNPGTNGMKN